MQKPCRMSTTAVGAETGAGIGAVVGGGVGLLAGLGMLAIPGLGPVVAIGWLATTAVGAIAGSATGGIVGALVGAGLSEPDAHVYSEAVRRGGTLVTVRTSHALDKIEGLLNRQEPINPAARRKEYETSGWTAFDPSAPAYQPENTEIERQRRFVRSTNAARKSVIVRSGATLRRCLRPIGAGTAFAIPPGQGRLAVLPCLGVFTYFVRHHYISKHRWFARQLGRHWTPVIDRHIGQLPVLHQDESFGRQVPRLATVSFISRWKVGPRAG